VRGVADNVITKLRAMGAITPPQRHRGVFLIFDPEAVKLVLDKVCRDAGVEVLLHAFVTGRSAPKARSRGFALPIIQANTGSRRTPSWTPAATAISPRSAAPRRGTATAARSILARSERDSVAFAADADISAESVHAAIRAAKHGDDRSDRRRLTKDRA